MSAPVYFIVKEWLDPWDRPSELVYARPIPNPDALEEMHALDEVARRNDDPFWYVLRTPEEWEEYLAAHSSLTP